MACGARGLSERRGLGVARCRCPRAGVPHARREGGPDDLERAIQAVVRLIREATGASAVALLTPEAGGTALTFRVVAWSDGDDALPDPVALGRPVSVVAGVAGVLAKWATEASHYAAVAGAPLGKEDNAPSAGWVVILGWTNALWTFRILEQVSWSLGLV